MEKGESRRVYDIRLELSDLNAARIIGTFLGVRGLDGRFAKIPYKIYEVYMKDGQRHERLVFEFEGPEAMIVGQEGNDACEDKQGMAGN